MNSLKYYFKRYFIILFAVFVVTFILCFYFFKTIKVREKELTSRGFRILRSIGKNFEEKHQGIQQTLTTYNQNPQTADSIDKYIKDIEPILGEKKEKINIKDSVGVYKEGGSWYLLYEKAYSNNTNNISEANVKNERTYKINVKNFSEPILNFRKDFFTDYIILYGDSIIYQSQQLAFASGIDKVKDTINRNKILKGSFQKEINLSGEDYVVFFHPLTASSDLNNITICGLISTNKFEGNKLTPGNYNFIKTILILLLLLLLIPFIKLLTMGKFERLYKRDIYFITASIFIIAILLNILFISNPNNLLDWNNKKTVLRLKNINHLISESFLKDINNSLDQLLAIEKVFENEKNLKKLIACNDPSNSHFQQTNKSLSKDLQLSTSEEIIFLLSSGMIQWKWINGNNINYSKIPNINVKTRDYFSKLQSDSINCYKSNKTKFYFQPLYSWTDQKNSIVFSKIVSKTLGNLSNKFLSTKIKGEILNDTLFALGSEVKLLSVMNQVIPNDLSFCIIDIKGNVQFHSDGKRNLRENFLEECGQNRIISSAIHNRIESSTDIQYYGSEYTAYISSLDNYPYFVVALCNKTMIEESKFNIIAFTLFCSMSTLIIIGAILLLSKLIRKKSSILKSGNNINSLIENTAINSRIINHVILALLVSILTFITFSLFLNNSDLLITAFVSPMWMILVVSLIIYLNYREVNYTHLPNSYQKEININFTCLWLIIILSLFLLYLTFAQLNLLKLNLKILSVIFYYLALSSMIIFYFRKNKIKSVNSNNSNFVFKFSLMMVLIIINICIIPGMNFYRIGSEQESIINTKRRTLEEAKKYEEQYKEIIKLNLSKETTQSILKRLTENTKYYDSINIKKEKNSTNREYKYTNLTNFYSLINVKYKINKHEVPFEKLALTQNKSGDSLWKWQIANNKHIHLDYIINCINFFDPNCKEGKLKIRIQSSDNIHYPFISGTSGTYIFLVIILFILYLIISFSYKKITLIEYFNSDYLKTWNEGIERLTDVNLLNTDNIIFVSLPGSGLENKIIKIINDNNYEATSNSTSPDQESLNLNISCFKQKESTYGQPKNIEKEDSITSAKNIYILNNFDLNEHGYKDLKPKLDYFKKIYKSEVDKVIWIAKTDPFEEMEKLKNYLKNSNVSAGQNSEDTENLYQAFIELLSILNAFHIENYPIPTEYAESENYYIKIINSECNHGDYLKRIKKLIPNQIKNTEINRNSEEELILKIQEAAKNYYYSIWIFLSDEEKFILYDMAVDGLTNYRNFQTLKLLLSKGLIIYDKEENRIMLMNKSFRNFILTVIEPSDALELENKIKVSGSWKITQTIITILFVIIGIMIAITQQALFNKILGLATAVSSFLPLLFTTLRNLGTSTAGSK